MTDGYKVRWREGGRWRYGDTKSPPGEYDKPLMVFETRNGSIRSIPWRRLQWRQAKGARGATIWSYHA